MVLDRAELEKRLQKWQELENVLEKQYKKAEFQYHQVIGQKQMLVSLLNELKQAEQTTKSPLDKEPDKSEVQIKE